MIKDYFRPPILGSIAIAGCLLWGITDLYPNYKDKFYPKSIVRQNESFERTPISIKEFQDADIKLSLHSYGWGLPHQYNITVEIPNITLEDDGISVKRGIPKTQQVGSLKEKILNNPDNTLRIPIIRDNRSPQDGK